MAFPNFNEQIWLEPTLVGGIAWQNVTEQTKFRVTHNVGDGKISLIILHEDGYQLTFDGEGPGSDRCDSEEEYTLIQDPGHFGDPIHIGTMRFTWDKSDPACVEWQITELECYES